VEESANQRQKIDSIVATVGELYVLDSDIDKSTWRFQVKVGQ
jgi:hypothetical protein